VWEFPVEVYIVRAINRATLQEDAAATLDRAFRSAITQPK